MAEGKSKEFEQAEKAHKEMENAAMRIVWFILEDEKNEENNTRPYQRYS